MTTAPTTSFVKPSIFLRNLDTSKFKKTNKKKLAKVNRHKTSAFPVKLYRMLEQVEQEGRQSIVSWNPDGRTFQVHKHERFANEVLPGHFKQSKYKSFQRQLNFYNFQRIVSGPLEGSYGHQMFIRGNEQMCHNIKRVSSTSPTPITPPQQQQTLSFAGLEQLSRVPRLVSTCTESHATPGAVPSAALPTTVLSREMSIGEIATLFQQHSTDTFLEGEDDSLLLEENEGENKNTAASRRESALSILNARLSFIGENFFVIPGEDDLPDTFDEEALVAAV
ncbi:MAG: hypothetical protein SGILL_006636 [Bacillariaceae sp.]